MLIHLTPQFYTCELSGPYVGLVDLQIDELDISLRAGQHLATRRPHPNKRYVVGCRKTGTKAISGILIETAQPVPTFTVVARWAIAAEIVVTHRVQYVVLDDEFDAVTDRMQLWYPKSSWGFASRLPEVHKESVPCEAQPRMQLQEDPPKAGVIQDIVAGGIISERTEAFSLPTVERARLFTDWAARHRYPAADSAFTTIPR